MADLSMFDKIKMFINNATSSPFFIVSIILGIVLILLMVLDAIKFKKMHRYFYIASWAIIFLLIVIKYGKSILLITDNLFEKIFQALYFPNYIVYTIILIISNVYFLLTFFKKNVRKSFRILGVVNMVLINILFLMILETIIANDIDIYDDLSVYTNTHLLAWLQLSTAVFISSLLIYLLQSAYFKVKRYDQTGIKYDRKLPPIIFDELYTPSRNRFTEKDKVFIWKIIRM